MLVQVQNRMKPLVRVRSLIPNIPRKSNAKIGNDDIHKCLYKYRHLVENVSEKLKKYRAITTRYDKLIANYESMVALTYVMFWLPM
jgi:transposase